MEDLSKRPQQHSEDSVLVSIAQKPLLVAVIFLLTAFLPWTFYWIVPMIVKSFQNASLQDLFQWFTLPLLFALVNFSIFYLWMNSAGHHSARFHQEEQQQDEFEVPNVQQERDLGDFKVGSCRHQEDEDFAPAEAEPAEARNQQQQEYQMQSSDASEILAMDDAPIETLLENASTRSNKWHQKSRSLTNGSLCIVPPAAPMEEPESSRPRAKRRNSSPKSKTPGAVLGSRRAERNRAFDIDPKVLDSLDTSRHIVARRNSSPKSTAAPPHAQQEDQEQQQQQGDGEEQQQHQMSKSTSSPSYVYRPPVREREPIPLDKDDLSARIEDFLTRFKKQRQESNLKALVSSSS